MMRDLRLLGGYVRQSFLEWTAFRSFLFTIVVNQAVTPVVGLALWSAALPDRPGISAYFVALLAVQLLTASQEYYSVTLRIYEGALNDDLLRPHPVVLAPLGANIAFRAWNLFMGVPIIGLAMLFAGVSFTLADALMAIPALLLAATLTFLFAYVLALSALWTEQASGIGEFGPILIFLLGGIAAPVFVLPEGIRSLGEALPFRAMAGFPAEIASGSLTGSQVLVGYAWQVLWTAAFVPFAVVVWRAGVRRYTAVGG